MLTTYDTFNLIMKILVQSVESEDEDLTFTSFAALGNFASDKGHRILLMNSNKIFPFFTILLKCI